MPLAIDQLFLIPTVQLANVSAMVNGASKMQGVRDLQNLSGQNSPPRNPVQNNQNLSYKLPPAPGTPVYGDYTKRQGQAANDNQAMMPVLPSASMLGGNIAFNDRFTSLENLGFDCQPDPRKKAFSPDRVSLSKRLDATLGFTPHLKGINTLA